MSWYISFYCATRNKKTKMLYPLGPFDNKGKYYDVLCKSRTSHIWDQNEGVIEKAKLEEVSEELRTALKPETSPPFASIATFFIICLSLPFLFVLHYYTNIFNFYKCFCFIFY